MRLRVIILAVALVPPTLSAAVPGGDMAKYLLPNGEPIVGVYYYPWYAGEPYGHVGWHPEFQFDNKRRPDHIREVLRAMADHGVNQASYSYWGDGSLPLFQTHLSEAEHLLSGGWRVYMSPYMEPPTIDKRFAEPEAQQFNIARLAHFLQPAGRSPAFCRLGGDAFINIYIAYYRPTEDDAAFRSFLRAKYGSIERLRAAWALSEYRPQLRVGAVPSDALPEGWGDITLRDIPHGTVAFADLQELRARRLVEGWRAVREGLRKRTGLTVRFTGDNSNTIVSPTEYMRALTGLTWYSFGYPLSRPIRRPKLISEIAKFTGTTFLYTISPGYVDRQQRWPGFHLEHDPFYYEYGWVKALQTMPEGIMILTHSEWFEGSIIDVTKEYGRRPYETTELYASIFKATFPSAFEYKRRPKPVAIVFNEWATYQLYDHGHNLADVYGLIKALECLSVDYDIIPESYLTAERLAGRRLLIVPSCGLSLHPAKLQLLARWVRENPAARLIVDATPFWKSLSSDADAGRRVIVAGERLGKRLSDAFEKAWRRQTVPVEQLRYMERLVTTALPPREIWPEGVRPSSSYEIARGPVLWAGGTAVVTAANTIPWGYIVHYRQDGDKHPRDYFADTTCPWRRREVKLRVAVPAGRIARQVQLLDSDAAPWSQAKDASRFFSWSFDRKSGIVTIVTRCKFHATFAIITGPAALRAEGLEIYPGGEKTARIIVANLSGKPLTGQLKAVGPPDLHIEPLSVNLRSRERRSFPLRLRAGPDCAVGVRTVRFELRAAGGQPAIYWARLRVFPPALLGLKTSLIAVREGQRRRVAIAAANVGAQTARDVNVEINGAVGHIPIIHPGEDAAVIMELSAPRREKASPLPATVSWRAGSPPGENGLRALSGADGVTVVRRAAGATGIQPATSAPNNIYIYFDVDEKRIPPGDYAAEAEIEFFDESGSFMIEYDSAFGDGIEDRYRDSKPVAMYGTRRWRRAVVKLPRAHFAGRQNLGADLRIFGRVLVRSLTLRPSREENVVIEVPAHLTWRCGSGAFSLTQTIRFLCISSSSPQAPAPAVSQPLWAVNPYGHAVPEAPVTVPRGDLPEALRSGPVVVLDGHGRPWPTEADERQVRAIVPLADAEQLFITQGKPPTPDLKVRDRSAGLGYVAVENKYLAALWDAERGGGLMSLVSKVGRADYAAPSAGLCTVEYTMRNGSHEVSTSWPGSVKIAGQGPAHVDILATADGPALTVADRWRIYARCRFIRLHRTITFKRNLDAVDFCPLVLRLDPSYFDRVFPLGVGFTKDGAPPRGWLETWHSEGWYFALSGWTAAATNAVALAVKRLDAFRRVRYGFFPADQLPEARDPRASWVGGDELQIRFRAQSDFPAALPALFPGLRVPSWWRPAGRRIYRAGDVLQVEALVAVAQGCSWRYARELALLEKYGVATTVGEQPPAGGIQIPELSAPLYMYRVHPPYPSAVLDAARIEGFAPEIALPEANNE